MKQYLRKVRATFSGAGSFVVNPGGIATHELKIGFSVSKDISGRANEATISIWNLNKEHRNAVGKELDSVMLEAGYDPPDDGSNVGILFKGNIRDVKHERDGPDIITTVTCGDGDKAFRSATCSKSFPKGTDPKAIVDDLYSQLEKHGIKKGELKYPADLQPYRRPYAMCGSATRELDRLGRGHEFYWSVQNETFEVFPSDGYLGGVVLISAKTGMIGPPTITDNGVQVKALLNPEVRPGRRVQVKSEVLEMNAEDGMFRVGSVTYSGDNRDGDFVMDISSESVKGKKVDEGKGKKKRRRRSKSTDDGDGDDSGGVV